MPGPSRPSRLTILLRVIFLLLAPGFTQISVASETTPIAQNGVLDLREWDFSRDGMVRLNGQWRFDWLSLRGYGGIPETESDTFLGVPAVWNQQQVNGSRLGGYGYGTYQLTILLDHEAPSLHLAVPEIHMASRLWVNGKQLFSAGVVGTSKAQEVPKSVPVSVALPRAERLNLVIEVSNFYHMEGGIGRAIKMGASEQILANEQNRLLINIFTIGALMFLGLHYLVTYLNQPEHKEQLWYALLAMLMLVRLAVVNKLTYLFGDHSHLLSTRLSYTTVFLVPSLYLLFLRSLFPDEFHKTLVRGTVTIGIAGTIIVWLTSPTLFTWMRDPAVIAIQCLSLYAIAMTLLACMHRREDSFTVLLIALVFGGTLIYDTLLYQRFIEANDISPFGFLVFVFGHAAILGRRTNRITQREREARHALAEMTRTLQSRIEARTFDLAEAKANAEQALMSKNRVLAAASHDLRQPLHALNLFVGMLETSIKQGTWPTAVAKISQLLQGLDKFLVNLGEISRLQSGGTTPNIQSLQLQTYFEVLSDEFGHECQYKGISLQFVPTSVWVRTDPDLVARMLRNLISNAVKYTNQGVILIGCRRRGNHVRIDVYDTGLGITEADQQTIFDEFYRTEAAQRQANRLGLGLSIVKYITDLLGHQLEVRSLPGKGSRFSVYIPRIELPAIQELAFHKSNESDTDNSQPLLEGSTILLVDDDEMICRAMEDVFAEWGCTIYTATSLNEALDELEHKEFEPDLIISDFRFNADDNGIEIARSLQDCIGSKTPVLIITAETDPVVHARIKSSGYGLLEKPVSIETLMASVVATLRIQAGAKN